jgi:hypothetical protein
MKHHVRNIRDNNCDIITKNMNFPFVICYSNDLYCGIHIENHI